MLYSDLKRFAPGGKTLILKGIEQSAHLLEEFGINTSKRLTHFMAQIAHESAGFKTTREYASGAAYEGRGDLGNTRPGDGKRFRGRGLIQVTGRSNVTQFRDWCLRNGHDCPDFTKVPTELEKFPWALLSAVWYWETRKLNRYADRDDLRTITRKINGGTNGLIDRQSWFRKAWAIWGGDDIKYAGHGKPLDKSKLVLAGAGLTGMSLSGLADISSNVSQMLGDISWGLGEYPILKAIALLIVFGCLGWILYHRWRQAKEYDT